MLKAQCLVKGFHNVWSHKSTWYFFPGGCPDSSGWPWLQQLWHPYWFHPKMSQCFHTALFKFTLVYFQEVWLWSEANCTWCNHSFSCSDLREEEYQFVPGDYKPKRNLCSHRPSPAGVVCAPITVLFRPLMVLSNHSLKIFLRPEGYFTPPQKKCVILSSLTGK